MELFDIYRYVFYGGLIGCGVFFVISAILFFVLGIPKVISDLSGRTARKAIEDIRLQNEQTGDKTYQSSAVNLERGKLTDKISRSGRLIQRKVTPFGTGVITEKISTQKLMDSSETEVLTSEETTLLSTPGAETDILMPAGETDVLNMPAGETDVLSAPAGATGRLAPDAQASQVFSVEYEITFIHTNEVIA